MEVKREKSFALGVFGAICGGLLGAGAIILLGQMGVISAIAGFVLAFCTLKGFELLGGKLDKKALIVCVAIMVITPYVAHHTSWAIMYCQAFQEDGIGLAFGDAFKYVYDLIDAVDTANGNTEVMSAFIKDLVFVYVFTALGGYTIVQQAIKQNKANEQAALDGTAPEQNYYDQNPFEQE